MPQLSGRFGPIPFSVTLDINGNGAVSFQSNGNNARITNLMVKVTTSVKQAVCAIYRGQVADSNLVNLTNSGSTGAPATGAIDIFDGEQLFVVWTGGDAGATATATFTGNTIPFDEIGPSSITWNDHVAANDGSLIFPALKSPDYNPGVSGWSINRDGTVEFNSATIRGALVAGGGAVTADLHGLRVVDQAGTVEYLVNRTGGFAARNIPDNGAISQLSVGQLTFVPGAGNPTPGGKTVTTRGRVSTNFDTVGTEETFSLDLVSGSLAGMDDANIKLRSEGGNGIAQPFIVIDANGQPGSNVEISAEFTTIDHKLYSADTGMFFCPIQMDTITFNITASANANQAIVFPTPFPVGRTIIVMTNLSSGAGASAGFKSRAFTPTNTGFTVNVNGPAAATFLAVVDYVAFVIPA